MKTDWETAFYIANKRMTWMEIKDSSSPESGDRRQDAANDHGSEPENDLREAEAIAEMWNKGNHVAAAMHLRSLIGEVSARSADTAGVLDRLARKMEEASHHAAKLSDLYAKDRLFLHAAEFDTARRVWELAREDVLSEIQNQTTQSGQGPAR